jgi:hypothetical protein
MEFNMNDRVQIRLTTIGRTVVANDDAEVRAVFPSYGGMTVNEDADGWSEWQLWEVMQVFGPSIYLAGKPPFDTTIRILDPAPRTKERP